jgi:WD40 repeat protein
LARLGTNRFRHEGWVETAVFSPDGRTLASAGHSDIIFWDAATGRERGRLTGNPSRVLSIAYSRDGKLLASGGTDNVIRLWDVAARKELRQFQGHKPLKDAFYGMEGIYGLAFTPDGRRLISRATDETVRLWDVASGKELRRWPGPAGLSPQGAALSPDGATLAIVAPRTTVMLWDVASGKEIRRLHPPGEDAICLAFSPDGKRLASGGAATAKVGTVFLWDVATGTKVRSFEGHGGTVLSLAFSADGKRLASGATDKTARVWDVSSGKELRQISRDRLPFYKLAFAPGDRELTVWGGDHLIHFWDLATGQKTRCFEGHQTYIESMAVSPDGRLIASGSVADVRLWDAARGLEVRRLTGLEGNMGGLAFSADGKLLVTGSYGGTIRFSDTATGKEVRRFKAPGRWISRLALSADGRRLAVWCQEKASALLVYDAVTGKELRRLTLPASPTPTLYGLSFSPDNKRLAAASGTDLSVRLWDAATGNPLAPLDKHGGGLTCLAFSADGRSRAVGCIDRTLTIWELATGRVRQKMKHGDIPTSVAFSADGRVLASATNGSYVNADNRDRCKIRLWDVVSGKELRRLEGHRGGVYGLAFAPDGTYLASASTDTTVLLWGPRNWAGAGLPQRKLTDRELAALWADLDGVDAARAHQAIGALAASPGQALTLLKERLRPVVAAPADQTGKLLAALDSERFVVREKAQKELAESGAAVEGALRRALKTDLSPETRLRVERLLAEIERRQRLRGLRALELLERVGTTEARRLVAALAGGDPDAWLTRRAKTSLARIIHTRCQQ